MINLIGAGPGNPDYLTKIAIDTIKSSDYIIAFDRISDDISDFNKNIITVSRVDDVVEELKNLDNSKIISIMASGDACFYGIIDLLKRRDIKIDNSIPGLSSVQYFFNSLQKSYSKNIPKSVHGREFDFSTLEKDKTYSFLIDKINNAKFISKSLDNLGFKGKLYCGYNLSYDNEKIIEINIGDSFDEPSALGVVVTEFVD